MDELEVLLRRLAANPGFWNKGRTDGGSMTWPSAPAEGDRKWPLVMFYCPGGHVLNTLNLSCSTDGSRWVLHSEPGGRGQQEAVNLQRTVFECRQCRESERARTRRVLTGKSLVQRYAAAVVAGNDTYRLT